METISHNRLAELNSKYKGLSVEERIQEIFRDFNMNEILFTSSFAANSAYLLHLFATASNGQQVVHFIDTSYHFPETLRYKDELSSLLNLSVTDVRAEAWKNNFTTEDKTWTKDPDYCCQINKVEPIQAILKNFKVWTSGLMRVQNSHRKGLEIFEFKGGILRFYPIIDVTIEQRDNYVKKHSLPAHPLVAEGYHSIGCTHCTTKEKGREGRWSGFSKTECGLHTK